MSLVLLGCIGCVDFLVWLLKSHSCSCKQSLVCVLQASPVNLFLPKVTLEIAFWLIVEQDKYRQLQFMSSGGINSHSKEINNN